MKTRRNRKSQKGGMNQKPILQNIEEKSNENRKANQIMKLLIGYKKFGENTRYNPLNHFRNKKAEGSYFPPNNKWFVPNTTKTKKAKKVSKI
jgi:hypothetical protein